MALIFIHQATKIQTIALIPPKLVLADSIDDLTNSNGRIDPNEIIEVTAIIKGIAKSVNVDVIMVIFF